MAILARGFPCGVHYAFCSEKSTVSSRGYQPSARVEESNCLASYHIFFSPRSSPRLDDSETGHPPRASGESHSMSVE